MKDRDARKNDSTGRKKTGTISADLLVKNDIFSTTRTLAEIRLLQKEATLTHEEPYLFLVHALFGAGHHLTEKEALSIWKKVIRHRGVLVKLLERPVNLRAVAIDWLSLQKKNDRPFSAVVVSRRMLSQLTRESRHDLLTGLPNRRYFFELAMRAMQSRSGKYGMVAYIDLNGFKSINDRLGHAQGDALLCLFAETALKTLRSRDIIARIGGDEFAVFLLENDHRKGRAVLMRLRSVFEKESSLISGELPVSFSFGIVTIGKHSISKALEEADARMYREKVAGT
ncbi:MAG TPA: GGDEF domain-containing protein [bacterium]|nr:GGDEF domain-containing protein [bacterium]